jgi:hypothetical protein
MILREYQCEFCNHIEESYDSLEDTIHCKWNGTSAKGYYKKIISAPAAIIIDKPADGLTRYKGR